MVRHSERSYIVFVVKGPEKIAQYIQSSFSRWFVKPREFLKKLLVRNQSTRHLVLYTRKFVISRVRFSYIYISGLKAPPCMNYVHSRWGYAFSVRMCIPGETHSHSRWGYLFHDDSSWPGMHILTGNGDVPHRECTSSPEMGMFLTANVHPLRQCGYDSPGVHILKENGDAPHREWERALPGMRVLTRNAHSLYRVISVQLLLESWNW